MKVLFVTPPLHDDNPGGIQVAGRSAWHVLQSACEAELLEVSAHPRGLALAAAARRRTTFDLVLYWHLDLLPLAVALKSTRRAVFLHGIEAWRRPGWITRRLLKHTSIMANSSYTLERSRPWLDTGQAEVVHLGTRAPASASGVASTPVALMISRLDARERYKGHEEVLGAWSRLLRQVPDAQLFIVGDGDWLSTLQERAAQLGLAASVRFFGRVTEQEKETLLQAARCLVLPSRAEGFGLVYVEAMRMGRPCVVGSDAGREVVGAAGIAVDPGNCEQLTAALAALLTCGETWQRCAAAARQRYHDRFTEQHFRARLLTALQRI